MIRAEEREMVNILIPRRRRSRDTRPGDPYLEGVVRALILLGGGERRRRRFG
jgi:hypothetical protein